MANPSIPSGFKPLVQGYAIGDPGGVVATETAGGLPRVAMQFDRGAQPFQVTLLLSPAAFSVWTAWYMRLVAKGSKTFDMELDSGMGCQTHACVIVPGSYSAVPVLTTHRSVSFTVLAVSRIYDLTEADAQTLVDLWNEYGADLDGLFPRLAVFANSDTRVLDF